MKEIIANWENTDTKSERAKWKTLLQIQLTTIFVCALIIH